MIDFTNVTLRVNTNVLIEAFSCSITAKMHVGLVGKNGSGKTSLFNLILGNYDTDKGSIAINQHLQMAHVAQEITEIEATAFDYVLSGDEELVKLRRDEEIALEKEDGFAVSDIHERLSVIDGYRADSRASSLLLGLGFENEEIHLPVKSFSGGWRMRLNIAKALMCRSDILLLDEPTNHLDFETVVWLEEWLKAYQGILIIISHDRDFLDNTCNHIIHIDQKKALLYKGNYDDFIRLRSEKLALQQIMFEKNERTRAHLTKFIDRFGAKATKAKQAQSRVKALSRLADIAPVIAANEFNFAFLDPERTPSPLLTMRDASFSYSETKPILENITLTITPETRLGLLGKNGEGKSTLIKIISDELKIKEGEITRSDYLRIGYFAQHQLEYLTISESPMWHIQMLDLKASTQSIRNFLGSFGFHGEKATDTIERFSGGEKARLALAIIVYQKPNLLLLDEPTNHLDLEMREAIAFALQAYKGGVLMVSHDASLLEMCCDSFLLAANRTISHFDGDLNDYRTLVSERNKAPSANSELKKAKTAPIESIATADYQERKQQTAELRKLQREKETLEKAIQKLQEKVEKIDVILGDPDTYQNHEPDAIQKMGADKQALLDDIHHKEEAWLKAEAQIEQLTDSKIIT